MYSNYSLLLIFFCYSLSALTALSWSIFLFACRKRSPQNIYLGIIFFIIGLLYLRNSFMRLPVIDACNIYNPLSYFILIFIAPFAAYYVYFAVGEQHSLKHYLAHFIPFVSLGLIGITLIISNTPHIPFCLSFREFLDYRSEYPLYVGFFLLLMLTFTGQVIAYFSIALKKFIRIGKQYKIRRISLRPIKRLIMIDFLFLLYPMVCVGFMANKNSLSMKGGGFHLFVAVVITLISILNLKLKLPLQTFPDSVAVPDGEKNDDSHGVKKDVKANETDISLVSKIIVAFEENELFKHPDLRLQGLASELGSNRTYVSDCINSHFGCNFNQLLIRYRINAAKELLVETDMPLQKIIDEVGFNTRSSFYKAFKENVSAELSPTNWRKIHTTEFGEVPENFLNTAPKKDTGSGTYRH